MWGGPPAAAGELTHAIELASGVSRSSGTAAGGRLKARSDIVPRLSDSEPDASAPARVGTDSNRLEWRPARTSILLRTGSPVGRVGVGLELFDSPLGELAAPRHELRYSITAKRLPLLLLLPHLAPLPPSKRIRRLCTGWPRHWS